jgi:16S rRNA A1518/A1519 N6-dimethyltransferase RsmA/KsgA/DIM1 with predicted DNA glycosylase/AP lyase activity
VIEDQHFMLQKEVIDRMVAKPSTSDYSRLSVMLQWRYDMANVLFVPPESFDPPPRVDSAVVRMMPLAQPPVVNVKTLETLVQVAFSQRRKILRNTLGKWLDEKGGGRIRGFGTGRLRSALTVDRRGRQGASRSGKFKGAQSPTKKPVSDGLFTGADKAAQRRIRRQRANNLR